jgi:TRAP-type C4-dicarboxylate transport system permease small subunit
MKRIAAIIDRALFYFLSASLFSLVAICFLQVVCRYLFSTAFSWAEEVSIVILVWATWGGACMSVKKGIHLRILFLVDGIAPIKKTIIQLSTNILAVVFLAYIGITSKIIIQNMTSLTLLSLPSVPINVMYVSVPVGCIFMIYYILFLIYSDLKTLLALMRKET